MVIPRVRARRGFSLVEAVFALLLLAVAVLAAASSEAWTARLLVRAEAREDAATVATALLDSLVAAGASGGGGVLVKDGLRLAWTVQSADGIATLRLRVSAPGRPQSLEEAFSAMWAPPPRALDRR